MSRNKRAYAAREERRRVTVVLRRPHDDSSLESSRSRSPVRYRDDRSRSPVRHHRHRSRSPRRDRSRSPVRREESRSRSPPKKPRTGEKCLKHILCNSLERKVRCPHGDRCHYSHSVEEQKRYLIQKPCIHLDENGKCSMPNCKFDHSIPKAPVSQAERVFKMCHFVQPDGTCKFGVTCKFLHKLPEQPAPMIVELSEGEEDDDEEEPEEGQFVDQDVQSAVQRCLAEYNLPQVKRKRVLTLSLSMDESVTTSDVLNTIHSALSATVQVSLLHDALVAG